MSILDECPDFLFIPAQFGFVQHQGTNTATTLVNDIFTLAKNQGPTVYCCSLDSKDAFNAIPHGVLFHAARMLSLIIAGWSCLDDIHACQLM